MIKCVRKQFCYKDAPNRQLERTGVIISMVIDKKKSIKIIDRCGLCLQVRWCDERTNGRDGQKRWEFIKENEKVRKHENKNSTKKVIKKTRTRSRKQELD